MKNHSEDDVANVIEFLKDSCTIHETNVIRLVSFVPLLIVTNKGLTLLDLKTGAVNAAKLLTLLDHLDSLLVFTESCIVQIF